MSTARFTLESPTPPPSPPLAIIGIGCLFPGSTNFTGFWSCIVGKRDAIRDVPPTHWSAADYLHPDPKAPDRVYAARGGFLDPVAFNPTAFGIPPSNLEATDSSQLLGLFVAQQALEDCGYTITNGRGNACAPTGTKTIDRSRISVILGVTGTLELVIPLGARLGHPIWRRALDEAGVSREVAEDVVQRIADAYVPWQENSFPGLLGNVVAGRIANRFDLGGTNCVVDAACASSLSALHLASMELATGRADVVLTGGVDTFNDIFMFTCFSKTPALSPTGNAKPFDNDANGTVLGEGLGMVVLKRLDDARRDGDRVYAILRGVGSSSDGKGNAIYAPRKEGQIEALRSAYRTANVTPDTIELVEAHGTGTRVGDATEVSALTEVYRASERSGPWCALGSIKSQLGHTKAAAGAAGLLKAAAALYHKVLPPTIKVTQPLDIIDADSPFYVNTEKRPWLPSPGHPRRAAVSAFGFGGSNFHCVLEEASPEKTEIDWTGEVQILAFHAERLSELKGTLAPLNDLKWDDLRLRADRSRREFQPGAPQRLLLVVQRDKTDVAELVGRVADLLDASKDMPFARSGEGIYFGMGESAGELGVLFPGQGAQYPGMLRDLTCHFPQAFSTLAAADRAFTAKNQRRLVDLIYPPPGFTPQARQTQEEALRATDVAQPALGAVSLGAWRVLESFGIQPGAFAGHSYGELTALCAAGRLGEEEFHSLSQLRGRLMADAGRTGGDAGGMAAVKAREERIMEVLREEGIDLVLANKNTPEQTVLSGLAADIDRAIQAFSRRKISTVRLSVAAAFHSSLVAGAREPFLAALAGVSFSPGQALVYANTTASPYPSETGAARELLGNQLARSVEWVKQIEAMYAAGVRSFLEVGPGGRLTGMVEAILHGRDATALALDASSGQRGAYELASCLAWLAARGHAVRLTAWDPADPSPISDLVGRKPVHTVPLCGANYVKPRSGSLSPVQNTGSGSLSPVQNTGSGSLSPVQNTGSGSLSPVQNTGSGSLSPVQNTGSGSLSPVQNSGSGSPPRPSVAPPVQAKLTVDLSLASNGTPTMSHPTPPQPSFEGAAKAAASVPDGNAVVQALQITRESLLALQKMQEQTAQLHRQFLDGQDSAHRTVHLLVEQQQRLLQASLGLPAAPLPQPVLSPVSAPLPAMQTAVLPVPAPVPVAPPVQTPTPPPVRVAPPAPPQAPVPFLRPPETVRVEGVLLEVIAEKTGYPVDMLELGMALDADLGIDSIKRVEILSSLQERLPDAPAVKPEHLGSLHTLRDIAAFLAESGSPQPTPAGHAGSNGSATQPTPVRAVERVQGVLLEVIAEKTGYPVDMLELGMALDADLGIDSIKRVEILSSLQERLPDAPAVKPEHLGSLHTLRDIAAFLADSPCAEERETVNKTKAKAPLTPNPSPQRGEGSFIPAAALDRSIVRIAPLPPASAPDVRIPAGAEVWISDEDPDLARALQGRLAARGLQMRFGACADLARASTPTALGALVILAPTGVLADSWLRDALLATKQAALGLRQGRGIFLTVSRLDGAFGLAGGPPHREPLDGGLAGLAKTVRQEWSEVHARALDLAETLDPAFAARIIEQEMFLSGPAEVGRSETSRVTLERIVEPLFSPINGERRPFKPGDVVLISGGARGVTAEAAVALARHFRPMLVLLGRSPPPQPEPDWLAGLSDENALKREMSQRHPGTAPRAIGEQVRGVLAGREIRATLERIRAAGGNVLYHSVDVRDMAAVKALVAEVRQRHGPVCGLIHGAGVLADAKIEDKTAEQFDLVYSAKVGGLRSLLAAVEGDNLKAIALFSSSTARFGRTGQVDYAIANEVLNKLAWQEASRRPGCRVVSLNWGPWDGGMVGPALKDLFAKEGVGVIPLAAGAELLVAELGVPPPGPCEVVVLAAGSTSPAAQTPSPAHGPTLPPAQPLAFERVLAVEDFPILGAHVLDGRPVLPLALILEWLAHAALVQNPGYAFHGCDDLRVLQGVTLEGPRAPALRVGAGKAVRREGFFIASAELRSRREDGREVLHARAEVVLTSTLPAAPAPRESAILPAYPHTPVEVYRDGLLFHGPALQGVEQIDGCGEPGISGRVRSAPAQSNWLRQPLRQHWLSDPLVIDSSFQLMILWSLEQRGAASLPCHARRYRQYRRTFPTTGVRVVVAIERATDLHALANIDFVDPEGKLIARIEGYECVIDPTLQRAFKRNVLASV